MARAYVRHRRGWAEIQADTAIEHRRILWDFAEAIGGQALSEKTVGDWWASTAHLAPGTRRNRRSIVRGFLDWLVIEGVIKRNVAVGLKAPKAPRQVHRALNGSASTLLDHAEDQRTRLVIVLGLQAGLRRAEIAHLQVGDINWANKDIFVTGKGGHERFVPITRELERELKTYLAQCPLQAGPLIRRLDGRGGITPRRVYDLVRRAAEAAGVKMAPGDGVATHALRHTCATDVADKSEDPRVVQELLGHANLSTTSRYIGRLRNRKLATAVEGRCYTCAPSPCTCP